MENLKKSDKYYLDILTDICKSNNSKQFKIDCF